MFFFDIDFDAAKGHGVHISDNLVFSYYVRYS